MIVKKKIYVTPEVTFELLEEDSLLTEVSRTETHGTTTDIDKTTGPGFGGSDDGDGDGMNGAKGGFFDWDEEW